MPAVHQHIGQLEDVSEALKSQPKLADAAKNAADMLLQLHNNLVKAEQVRLHMVGLLTRLRRRIDYDLQTNELTFNGGAINDCEINEDLFMVDRSLKKIASLPVTR